MADTVHKVSIVGSGPAGWTAALYTARADLNPILFEGELDVDMLPGGQLMTTTEVENFPGYPEGVTGPEMMEQFQKQAEKFGTKTIPETVTSVDISSRPFTLKTAQAEYKTESVIVATGASAKYLGLESEKQFMNKGVSGCATCDGALPRFRNKPIVVVGGGDTAMEEATFLSRFGSVVHIIHRRDAFRASKIMAKRVIENPKVKVEWNTVVDDVLGNDKDGVTGVRLKDVNTSETREIEASGFFVAIGHKPNSDVFTSFLDHDDQGYLVTKPGSSNTNVEGIFACGDVQDKIYRQAVTAAGSGCQAALDCTRWLESQE